MRPRLEQDSSIDAVDYRELRVLSVVDSDPEVTQRDLARRAGIALGLTNFLIRNLVQKGYIRVSNAGWKRRLYALTPDGITHKVDLTVSYIHRVLNHYQGIRQTLREQLESLGLNEESSIALYGTGEFAELVYLGLKEIGIKEIQVYDDSVGKGRQFLGMPVADISKLVPDGYDRVLVAFLDGSRETHEKLADLLKANGNLVTFFNDK